MFNMLFGGHCELFYSYAGDQTLIVEIAQVYKTNQYSNPFKMKVLTYFIEEYQKEFKEKSGLAEIDLDEQSSIIVGRILRIAFLQLTTDVHNATLFALGVKRFNCLRMIIECGMLGLTLFVKQHDPKNHNETAGLVKEFVRDATFNVFSVGFAFLNEIFVSSPDLTGHVLQDVALFDLVVDSLSRFYFLNCQVLPIFGIS